jgi:hypothetical protein
MTTPITTSTFPKTLWPGVNAFYQRAYNEYPVEWDKLYDKFDSRRNYEQDVGRSGFGLLVQKPEGEAVTFDTETQGFTTTYRHTVYALGFVITQEAMDDDLYDVVAPRKAQELAFSARQTKEINGASVYNRAFNSAFVGGDGKELISSAHPNVAGGTWSNTLATAADLSEAALEQACIDISLLKDDRGLTIALVGEKLILPPQLEFEAARILKTQYRVGTDLNDINALKELGKFRKGHVINHFLTDADAWFIRTNAPHGMKYFERKADTFSMDNDWDTENAKFKVYGRYSFGWSDPRGIYASPGA